MNDTLLHFLEHFFASSILFLCFYRPFHYWWKYEKTSSILYSITLTLMIGLLYKLIESVAEGYMAPSLNRSMLSNMIGVIVPAIIVALHKEK